MGFKEKTYMGAEVKLVKFLREVPLSSTVSEQGIIGSARNNLLGLQLKEQSIAQQIYRGKPSY